MPRRSKSRYSSPQKFKQQTLFEAFDPSPPSSPFASFPRSVGPSKRKRARETSASSSNSDKAQGTDSDASVGAIRFESEASHISDEDCSPRRPKKRMSLGGAHVISQRASTDESLEETIAAPQHRKGKGTVILDSDDEILPRRRKLLKGSRPPTPEVDDDILDTDNQVLESRLRSRDKMSAFRKNLEKLKMLKGKKRSEISLESSSSGAEQSENAAGSDVPFEGAKPHHSGESDASRDESDDGDEDDFIVDDDSHGPPATQLPAAFSLSTYQDLMHHFKIICQLFVHVAVQPLVDRRPFLEYALKEEEYLSVPLQVTRRKLSGIRDSLVASSVWRSDFKKVLERYPKFTLVPLDFTVPECDACHLGGRLSTLVGRLSGEPYDEYDFEDISDERSESDGNSEGNENQDSDVDEGRDIKAEFHLGRFCAARTRVYHRFSHWEYSLYKSLQREIMEARDKARRFIKVAYFGGIKPPSDLHDADGIMEWLDERGIIEMEWQKVRQMMDSARSLERGEDTSVL